MSALFLRNMFHGDMGSGASNYSRMINRKIEEDLKKQSKLDSKTLKLLLLGPAESGKSTVLKQMKLLHAEGFSSDFRQQQVVYIRRNIVDSAANIINAMSGLNIQLQNRKLKEQANIVLLESQIFSKGLEGSLDVSLSSDFVKAIKLLWADKGVQETFSRRDEYHLLDSTEYFINNLDRISESNYTPNEDDVLRCRLQTTGVVEMKFEMKSTLFRVVDVGGQRSERRKWIQCFEGVNSIIFVASLSEYNQQLEEDATINRMSESLNVFEWICNHELFKNTPLILFLNKKDIFVGKIKQFPLMNTFPDYTGSDSPDESMEYIRSLFKKQNRNEKRKLYTHFTCATDTNQLKLILDYTVDAIVKQNLKGLIV